MRIKELSNLNYSYKEEDRFVSMQNQIGEILSSGNNADGQQNANIENLSKKITKLEGKVADFETRIAALETKANEHQTINDSINTLEGRVSALENPQPIQ